MIYNSLENYYRSCHIFRSKLNWSFEDIESRMPWEMTIYKMMYLADAEEEKNS